MQEKGAEEKVNADNLYCKLEQVIHATLIQFSDIPTFHTYTCHQLGLKGGIWNGWRSIGGGNIGGGG